MDNTPDIKNDLIAPIKRINNKIKLLCLINRAKTEYDRNNFEGCENTCNEILRNNPENSLALRGLGCVMQAKDEKEKAANYYKRALVNSEHKEIEYTLLGTLYYMYDEYEDAIKYYNLAIDINDNYDSAYEGRNQAMLENHLKIADLQEFLINNKEKLF